MRVIKCPSCGRITDQLEMTGTCEHCGADATSVGEVIETEIAGPPDRRFGIWRPAVAIIWFAAAVLETLVFLLPMAVAMFLSATNTGGVELQVMGIVIRIVLILLLTLIAIRAWYEPIVVTAIGLVLYVIWTCLIGFSFDLVSIAVTLVRGLVIGILFISLLGCLRKR